jgi:cell division transport system ATP-binding protein
LFFKISNFTDRSIEKNLQFVLEATGWRDKTLMSDRIDEVLPALECKLKAQNASRIIWWRTTTYCYCKSVTQPSRIILADEPTGNLDPETSNDIMTLLKSISTERQCAV